MQAQEENQPLDRRPFSIEALAAKAAKRELNMKAYLCIVWRVHGLTAHAACKLMVESGNGGDKADA